MLNLSRALGPILSAAVRKTDSSIYDVQRTLATGKNPNINAADRSVSSAIDLEISLWAVRQQSLNQTQNIIEVARTGLDSATSLVYQLQTLASSASSGTFSVTDLANMNATFLVLAKQIISTASNATVNGKNLLVGTTGAVFYVGISTATRTATAMTIAGINLDSIGAICTALSITSTGAANSAIYVLSTQLTNISAGQSSLSANSLAMAINSTAASSISSALEGYIAAIENIDATALQIKLQELNQQQSVNYYLVSQLNLESEKMLAIFK
jgi:hypothetical protein